MKKTLCIVVALASALAFGSDAMARSHRSYGYQGGHYAGGHGSSHRGGHYRNARTHNHYTHHSRG